jgi:hypothetical protein
MAVLLSCSLDVSMLALHAEKLGAPGRVERSVLTDILYP